MLRADDHPGYGRLTLDLGNRPQPVVIQNGNAVTVAIGSPVNLSPERLNTRNLLDYWQDGAVLNLLLASDVTVRPSPVSHRLVLDLLDPASQRPAARTAQPMPTGPSPATRSTPRPVVASAAAKPPSPAPPVEPPKPQPAVPMTVAAPVPVAPPTPPTPPPAESPGPETPKPQVPLASTALVRPVPDDTPGHVLSLPFAPTVGAAAFARGTEALAVFDTRAPLDLQALSDDPVFSKASLRLLPDATVLSMALPEGTELRLRRTSKAWTLTAIGGTAVPDALGPIMEHVTPAGLALSARKPGGVVSVPDPLTGGILLVGTQLTQGQALPIARLAPDFSLLPTWQGVVVQASSDAVRLRVVDDGFVIGADGEGRKLALSPQSDAEERLARANRMSRLMDLPADPVGLLVRRMQGRMLVAAAAPPQSRLGPRKRVAEAMLALGLGAEASAALDVAERDDARAADDPMVMVLASVAALLAGRPGDVDGLDDPRLDGTDEIQFWRAVRDATRLPSSPKAAQVFANTLPLLESYPEPLRRKLLPMVAETMALGGQTGPLAALLDAGKDDPTLDLARAMAAEAAGGDPAPALARYDALAQSRDRKVSAQAGERAAELRLAKGLATPAQTAETLRKLLLAWRDDSTDVDHRMRISDLLAQSGQFPPALAILREAEQQWPEQKERVHQRLLERFAQVFAPESQSGISAFDLVTLAEENPDLIPAGDAGQALAERLSDRLMELDLPEQAAPLFERLAKSAPPGFARAAFGSRLAAARLQMNDAVGAVDALATTTSETLPQSLLEQRTLTFAAAVAAQHDLPSADNALRDLDTEAADQTMAQLHETAKDWPNAVNAWLHALQRDLSPDGTVTQAQATILVRLASAATQAGDDATLARLHDQFVPRMPVGKLADTFNLLTDRPVQSQADLPLVTRDMGLVAAVPGALAAMAPPPVRAAKTR